jgi:protein phosphatase
MLVIGGRTDTVGDTVSLEVYDTETSEWNRFPTVQRFRHACWCVDTNLFMHGGFDNESPTVPTDAIMKLDALAILKSAPHLVEKIENYTGISNPSSPGGSKPSTPGGPGSQSPNEP